MTDVAVHAEGLSKRYLLGRLETGFHRLRRAARLAEARGETWALNDVSFEIPAGQAIALIGPNGAGKSTLLKILAQVVEPTSGWADVRGRVGALLEVGTGFHVELTGRENVYLAGTILGMRRREIAQRFDDIVEFAGVGKYIDTPVKRYSNGMYIRLGFAVSAFLEPEILIVDEVLAVGDAEFQKRCVGRMSDVAKDGRTVIFVSHNMQPVRALCERALLLRNGSLVDDGETDAVVRRYLASLDSSQTGVRRWDDPADRPGDGTARLAEVRVSDRDGEATPSFFSTQEIHVSYEFELAAPVPGFVAALELAAEDGSVVFRSYSSDKGDAIQQPLGPGTAVLGCIVPSELLNTGRYLVNVRGYAHGVDLFLNEQAVLAFDVTADHGESFFLGAASRPGSVAPLLDWRVVPQAAATGESAELRGIVAG
jgi:lipopolysaccharide transport system ATP-binding protein